MVLNRDQALVVLRDQAMAVLRDQALAVFEDLSCQATRLLSETSANQSVLSVLRSKLPHSAKASVQVQVQAMVVREVAMAAMAANPGEAADINSSEREKVKQVVVGC